MFLRLPKCIGGASLLRAVLLAALVSLSACINDADTNYQRGYSEGHVAGQLEGEKEGFARGFAAARPSSEPEFSENVKVALDVGAIGGGLFLLGALLFCTTYVIGKRDEFFAMSAKTICCLVGVGIAIISMKFLYIDNIIQDILLYAAWRSRILLLFVISFGGIAGYFAISILEFIAREIDGLVIEAWLSGILGATITILSLGLLAASEAGPRSSSYMFCYILLGILFGALIYCAKLLLAQARKVASR